VTDCLSQSAYGKGLSSHKSGGPIFEAMVLTGQFSN